LAIVEALLLDIVRATSSAKKEGFAREISPFVAGSNPARANVKV